MPKQIPSFNLSWTPEELENGGYDDIINIIKIAHKQKISVLITTDGYTLMLEGQFTDSNRTEACYSFVDNGEVVIDSQFVDWDAVEEADKKYLLQTKKVSPSGLFLQVIFFCLRSRRKVEVCYCIYFQI